MILCKHYFLPPSIQNQVNAKKQNIASEIYYLKLIGKNSEDPLCKRAAHKISYLRRPMSTISYFGNTASTNYCGSRFNIPFNY